MSRNRISSDQGCIGCGAEINRQAMRCIPCANLHRAGYSTGPLIDAPALAARLGSEALLKAHLRTGRHWITDPARFAAACASVGL